MEYFTTNLEFDILKEDVEFKASISQLTALEFQLSEHSKKTLSMEEANKKFEKIIAALNNKPNKNDVVD